MMRSDTKVNGSAANKAYGRLAADRKKVVIAVVLIGVMVFMWVRVIAGKGPEEAGAAVSSQQSARCSSLPLTAGRSLAGPARAETAPG